MQMATRTTPFKQIDWAVPGFPGITAVLVQIESGMYVVIPPMCAQLGDLNAQAQIDKLRADERFVEHLVKVPYDTRSRGMRESWGIRRHQFGNWIRTINPNKVKPELRDRLDELDQIVTAFTDQLVFGVASTMDPAPGHASLGSASVTSRISPTATIVRGDLHFDCPKCGAKLCLVSSENGTHVMVGAETP
jgi:hypothetical protein